jgi:hypothetical protein
MTTNDELVSLRQAFAAPAGPALEPEACPPSDRIWLAVRGELPPDELRTILDHIATCQACAEDWRIAMAFEEEARTAAVGPAAPARILPFAARFGRPLVAAAMILAAVVAFNVHQPKAPGGYRGDGTAVESSLQKATLPRQSFVLLWTSVQGAESYNLSVKTSVLDPLFDVQGVAATTYKVPASALENLPPGATVLWTVTPVTADGGQLQGRTFTSYVR